MKRLTLFLLPFLLTALGGCAWQTGTGVNSSSSDAAAIRPRAFTTANTAHEPRSRFVRNRDSIVLQVIGRAGIREGGNCQLLILDAQSGQTAYRANWIHRRHLDQSNIVCQAQQYTDWRQTPGNYRVVLRIDDQTHSSYSFTLKPSPESTPENHAGSHARAFQGH